jgi:hypothetical protein
MFDYSQDGYIYDAIVHASACIPSCYISELSDISRLNRFSIRKTSTRHAKDGMMLRKTSGMMHLIVLKMNWKMTNIWYDARDGTEDEASCVSREDRQRAFQQLLHMLRPARSPTSEVLLPTFEPCSWVGKSHEDEPWHMRELMVCVS